MTAEFDVFRISHPEPGKVSFPIGVATSRATEYSDTFYFEKFEKQFSYPFKNFDLKDGQFSDFMPSDVAHFLCSDRFRALIDENWGAEDRYEWFTVDVHNAADVRPYHVLHILRDPDILDVERSKFAGPSLVVPAFKNLLGHNIFSPPNYAGEVVFIRDSVKRRFALAKLSGVEFRKVRAGAD
ncbi:hypothetical protein FBZ99_11540 [Rhizobium sp. ERR 1071]|uniref:hypothetical protein n=1 Tax=Rhizobium sp. ERR 1071 TaxID=2572677 RepID=UPI001199E249|nr:hypothetical protein [Rhizobium sp. ERR1071]TWB09250.1 hypothetical protein FBZ99_11540 [Rhizobium sp. ERR1071]